MNKLLIIALIGINFCSFGQNYAPAAGQPGSTAIYYADPNIVGWATGIEVIRGFINIEDSTIEAMGDNRASFGNPALALGQASTDPADVVSLGDGGMATITFEHPIFNGPGFDFAIFENSFSDTYLELAHIEVSSNGLDFVRFPSHSQVQSMVQIHGFGSTDPTMIYNLAGKYRGGYGTPFDLNELQDSSGININNITHIRIIDVVGSVGDSATYDSHGNKINEPFPTPYESGGFDLEAVGAINQVLSTDKELKKNISIYPNPAMSAVNVDNGGKLFALNVFDTKGQCVLRKSNQSKLKIELPPGVYYFQILSDRHSIFSKVIFN